MYLSITKTKSELNDKLQTEESATQVGKYSEFEVEQDAIAHAEEHNGIVFNNIDNLPIDDIHVISGVVEVIKWVSTPKTYQELRQADLPSIGDQMDMQYWDAINGTTLWKDMITGVKTKHPKVAL